MALKRRSLDPEIWSHTRYRRAPLVAREVWIALITLADDEGRIRMDTVTLAELIFSPATHRVRAQAVEDALLLWEKEGWLVRYGEDCMFLTGWYEHQYIPERDRQPSSLPDPPVPINTWAVADHIRDVYKASRNGDGDGARPQFRPALRAFMHLTGEEQETILNETCLKHGSNKTEGKGKGSRKGQERKQRPAPKVDAAPGEPEQDKPPKEDTSEQAAIRDAWTAFGFEDTLRDSATWAAVRRTMRATGTAIVHEWATFIRESGVRPDPDADPAEWFKSEFMGAIPRKVQFTWRGDKPKQAGFRLETDRTKFPEGEFTL